MNIKERLSKLGREVVQLYVGGLIAGATVILKEGIVRAVLTWLQVFTGVLLAGQAGIAPETLGDFGWATAVAVANVAAIVSLITSLRFLSAEGLTTVPTQENDYAALHEEYKDAYKNADTLVLEDANGNAYLAEEQPTERLEIRDTEDEAVSNLSAREALALYGRNSDEAQKEN